jgi:hypothetical protein
MQSNSHTADSYEPAAITGSTIAIEWVADNGLVTSDDCAGSFMVKFIPSSSRAGSRR